MGASPKFGLIGVKPPRKGIKSRLSRYPPFVDIVAAAKLAWAGPMMFRFDDIITAAGHAPIRGTFYADDWRKDLEETLWFELDVRGILIVEAAFRDEPCDPNGDVLFNPDGTPMAWEDAMRHDQYADWIIANVANGTGIGLAHPKIYGGALVQAKNRWEQGKGIGNLRSVQGRNDDLARLKLIRKAGKLRIERKP